MSIHVCMIFVEGGVGEENVLEWGGEEIVFLHYFILEIQFLYIFIFIETNKKWQNCTLQKNVNMISFLL